MINPADINTEMFKYQSNQIDELESIRRAKSSDEKLKKAASEFESVFISQMLNIMDSTVEKSDFMRGGEAENTFKTMMNQEIARNIASNPATSFGLAKQIYEQLKNRI